MKNPGIYILTSPSGKQYVGKDNNLPSRVRDHLRGNSPQCPAIHDAIQKYGSDTFSVEIIQYPGISHEALKVVERWKIRQLQTVSPDGYNLTEGGDGGSISGETRQKISKSNKKRVANGTHNFLDSDFQRQVQKKRLEDGTHHLLDGEIQRKSAKKRVADGTHNFLGENNPSHKQLADGTHNFLDSEVQRRAKIKRDAVNKKRLKDGTHHFLGENNPSHARKRKRQKAEWCYIIALSRFWYEIHDYTLKRRSEFLCKDIPNMSNAEQEYLFE
ncbi:MAG: GIY-YIG nuclease family protein [Candidatus Poribacteria bacterium]|nr:GIY-YIG nuclease family protein [Candidatus Poribacteria bacterium]